MGCSVCTNIKRCGISTEITLKLKTKGVEFLMSFNEVSVFLERGVKLFPHIYHIVAVYQIYPFQVKHVLYYTVY